MSLISATTVAQTTPTAVYTSSGATAVTFASFTNYAASAATLTLHIVKSGGSAADNNMLLDALSITAGDTHELYVAGEKLLLDNGDAIYASSDTATAINAIISYTSI